MDDSYPSYENPFQSPLADTSPTMGTEAEVIRNEYIKHEASVKSIGLLYLLGAIFIIPISIILMGAAILGATATTTQELAFVLIASAAYLGLGVLQLATGLGLRKLKPWTRIVASIFSAIGLLAIPLGTIISAYFLYLLLSKKGAYVFSPEYKEIIAATPHIKYSTSKLLLVLLAVLIGLMALALVGLLFSGRPV